MATGQTLRGTGARRALLPEGRPTSAPPFLPPPPSAFFQRAQPRLSRPTAGRTPRSPPPLNPPHPAGEEQTWPYAVGGTEGRYRGGLAGSFRATDRKPASPGKQEAGCGRVARVGAAAARGLD